MKHDMTNNVARYFHFNPPHDFSYILIKFMAPNTTPTKHAKICTMRAAGYSNDEIRAALTGRHDLSDRQIYRIMRRYAEKKNYYKVMP